MLQIINRLLAISITVHTLTESVHILFCSFPSAFEVQSVVFQTVILQCAPSLGLPISDFKGLQHCRFPVLDLVIHPYLNINPNHIFELVN